MTVKLFYLTHYIKYDKIMTVKEEGGINKWLD